VSLLDICMSCVFAVRDSQFYAQSRIAVLQPFSRISYVLDSCKILNKFQIFFVFQYITIL